jgi:anti-sigma regulatory factor (Ser/Thr protein kinase)
VVVLGQPSSEPDRTETGCVLDGTPTGSVRGLVREVLAGRSGVVVEDAVLVVDELVTNALRHGEAPRRCRLVVLRRGDRLRIEVDDASPREPVIRTPDLTGGRGMVLVDGLAAEWGVDHHDDHKTVWAELVLTAPHAPHLKSASTWPE